MNASKRPETIVGRLVGTVFFLAFLGMGVFFTYMVLRMTFDIVVTRFWEPTPCRVEKSRGVRTDDGYALELSYTYQYGGKTYTSTTFSSQGGTSSEYSDIQRLIDRYPAKSEASCHVNPATPQEATLEHASFWFVLFIPLPLIFVFVGGGGLVMTWTAKLGSASADGPKSARPKSLARVSLRAVGLGVFAFFFVIGLIVFWFIGGRSLLTMIQARSWPEIPCTVVSSRVLAHPGDESTTYSVDILYEYEFGGRPYRSNAYGVFGGSSSGLSGKREIVRAHPGGTKRTCWVNPSDPYETLLDREFTPWLLFGLIPLVFVAVGAIGIVYTLRRRRASRTDRAWKPRGDERSLSSFEIDDQEIYQAARGPIELEVRSSPLGKLVGMTIFCAFWNGIVSVFVYQLVQSFARGRPEWFLALFLIPFVLIGLLLFIGVLYFFLAIFNPRPRLVVSTDSVPPGGTVALTWEVGRRAQRIDRLVMVLEGREEATYRRGTRSYTDREYFARVEIADTGDPGEIAAGRATFTVPAGTMHSFEAQNNKVIWGLRLHGDIRLWPNIDSEFAFRVLPAPRIPDRERHAEEEVAS